MNQRSNLGLGLVTAYMVADTGLNIATSVMDYYAKKDTIEDKDGSNKDFEAATALSGLSAGLLFMATVGGIPEMMGPTFGTIFSFMALGASAGGLSAYARGYDKLDDSTSSNQKSALVLNIVSVSANLLALIIQPVWSYYRRTHSENSPLLIFICHKTQLLQNGPLLVTRPSRMKREKPSAALILFSIKENEEPVGPWLCFMH